MTNERQCGRSAVGHINNHHLCQYKGGGYVRTFVCVV
nr:MAG TPA: hypothetical protein [Caudoviricetes sp.]